MTFWSSSATGVIVQTMSPDAEAIQRAARHDANGFIGGELKRREALGYPPFADLIRTTQREAAVAEVGAAVERAAMSHKDVALSVDVDPQ